jgi:hypothetical protein
MTRLNETAKAALRQAGVSQAEWARAHFTDAQWHGDACGCSDDRCIGFHHGGTDDCGCLPVMLDQYAAQRAGAEQDSRQ